MELKKFTCLNKMAILFFILFLISMIYVVGILDNMQSQIDDMKTNLTSVRQELEGFKNELSDANYDDEITDIYNKINELKELYEADRYHGFYDYNIQKDMYDIYYGRLYIPDLDISVALYRGNSQYITDRNDSANIIFSYNNSLGTTIADHNNQEFLKLFYADVGTRGYINSRYLERVHIECTDVFNGYNTGRYIVNEDGKIVMGLDDYLIYTCNYSGGVFISLWNVIE